MTLKPRKGESEWSATYLARLRGHRMKLRRRLLGLSQANVTAMLPDVTEGNPNVIGRIESGDVACTADRMLAIAKILRVPFAWFYKTDEWTDVEEEDDPYLMKKHMYVQILGPQRVKRLPGAIESAGEDMETVAEIRDVRVKKDILAKGRNHEGAYLLVSRSTRLGSKVKATSQA